MPQGFQCDDGWFDLLYRVCERLEPKVKELSATLPEGQHFEVEQVKEKLGGLRFYVNHHTAAIDLEIERARQESLSTCENCGRRGTLSHKDGRLVTCCEECLLTRVTLG
jgi:hypothetical protein